MGNESFLFVPRNNSTGELPGTHVPAAPAPVHPASACHRTVMRSKFWPKLGKRSAPPFGGTENCTLITVY
jgi:hypothetical protein